MVYQRLARLALIGFIAAVAVWFLGAGDSLASENIYYKSGTITTSQTWANGTFVLTGNVSVYGTTLSIADTATVDLNGFSLSVSDSDGKQGVVKTFDSGSPSRAKITNTGQNLSFLAVSNEYTPTAGSIELVEADVYIDEESYLGVQATTIKESTFTDKVPNRSWSSQGGLYVQGTYVEGSTFTGRMSALSRGTMRNSVLADSTRVTVGGSFVGNTITNDPGCPSGCYFNLWSSSLNTWDSFTGNTNNTSYPLWLGLESYDWNSGWGKPATHVISGATKIEDIDGLFGGQEITVKGTVFKEDFSFQGFGADGEAWCEPDCLLDVNMSGGSALTNSNLTYVSVSGLDDPEQDDPIFKLRGITARNSVIDLADKNSSENVSGQIVASAARTSSIFDSQVWAGPNGNTAVYGTYFAGSDLFALGSTRLSGLKLVNTNVSITRPGFGGNKAGTFIQSLESTNSNIYATDAYFDNVNLNPTSSYSGFDGDFLIQTSYDGCEDQGNCDVTLSDRSVVLDPEGEFVANKDGRVLFQEGTYTRLDGTVYPNNAVWGSTGSLGSEATGAVAAVQLSPVAYGRAMKESGTLLVTKQEGATLFTRGLAGTADVAVYAPELLRDDTGTYFIDFSNPYMQSIPSTTVTLTLPAKSNLTFVQDDNGPMPDCEIPATSDGKYAYCESGALNSRASKRASIGVRTPADATPGEFSGSIMPLVKAGSVGVPFALEVSREFAPDSTDPQLAFERDGVYSTPSLSEGGVALFYSTGVQPAGVYEYESFVDDWFVNNCAGGQPFTDADPLDTGLWILGKAGPTAAAKLVPGSWVAAKLGKPASEISVGQAKALVETSFGVTVDGVSYIKDVATGAPTCTQIADVASLFLNFSRAGLVVTTAWDAFVASAAIESSTFLEAYSKVQSAKAEGSVLCLKQSGVPSPSVPGELMFSRWETWATAEVSGTTLRCV